MISDEIIKSASSVYRTPFYIYNKAEIIEHANIIKDTIFEKAQLFFSMKANPEKEIIKCLLEQGCGVEVASLGELNKAIDAGCLPNNLIFTGPGKQYEELEAAIKIGIYCINIENLHEIEIISDIATKHQKDVNIGIRVNLQGTKSGKISMNGVTQFGIGEGKVSDAIAIAKKNRFIHVIGFQVYSGTQILDADVLTENVKQITEVVFELARTYEINMKYINFGGGFGVPYFQNDVELDIEKLKKELLDVYEQNPQLADVERIIFESGRYILAEAGCFVVKVLYEKEVNDSKFIICDGGSNFHSSAAFLGRFVRNNFPMHSISEGPEEKVTIVGNLCTPTDVIGQNVLINKVDVGDLIVIEKSGAYGLSFSPLSFLSHRLPSQIMYDNGSFIDMGKGINL